MKEIRILTRDDIADELKSMVVGGNGMLPIHMFSFIVMNPEYDPDGFSQEIDDSENEVDMLAELQRHMMLFNECPCWPSDMNKNSERWYRNRSKKCQVKLLPLHLTLSAVEHDTVRNYYSDENLSIIMDVADKFGGIVKIC